MLDPLNHIMLIVILLLIANAGDIAQGWTVLDTIKGNITPVAIAFLFTEVVLWVLYFSLEVVG